MTADQPFTRSIILVPIDAPLALLREQKRSEGYAMPLTRNFRDTVRARAKREPAFRKALFQGAVQALLQGETDQGRVALRAYINATVGFARLCKVLGRSPKT